MIDWLYWARFGFLLLLAAAVGSMAWLGWLHDGRRSFLSPGTLWRRSFLSSGTPWRRSSE